MNTLPKNIVIEIVHSIMCRISDRQWFVHIHESRLSVTVLSNREGFMPYELMGVGKYDGEEEVIDVDISEFLDFAENEIPGDVSDLANKLLAQFRAYIKAHFANR